jgi:alpha-glucuronidase
MRRRGIRSRDLTRVRAYALLLAACGINAVAVNNVNVHTNKAHLLTDRLDEVAALADRFHPYGIRTHLSVDFASPITLGGLASAHPLAAEVRAWWDEATRRVYELIPDFGGYVVKADSEGRPGPFAYGRSHADGANLPADALAPFGGVVHWRAFVYNHRQDWRDRSTDRARAAFDHFAGLETQEYTGQQKHVCHLAPMWSEVPRFTPWGPQGPDIADVIGRQGTEGGDGDDRAGAGGGMVAVSNVGDDRFWTGHPPAQANPHAFGRLAWNPRASAEAILDEWIDLTFAPAAAAAAAGGPAPIRRTLHAARCTLHAMMDESRRTYERYTAPLGVGFMVRPGHHYGPDVDGYDYTPWGTYHFADRDGIGVDRTGTTGTGFAAPCLTPARASMPASARG